MRDDRRVEFVDRRERVHLRNGADAGDRHRSIRPASAALDVNELVALDDGGRKLRDLAGVAVVG